MASGYSGKINSIQDLLDMIGKHGVHNQPHSYLRNWFRGQTQHFDLIPGVYRPGFNVGSENERLKKEQHLTQDFKVQSAGTLTHPVTDIGLYFLQQHYGMPTRLLDWSTSPLSALYFATLSGDDNDGELYMMDPFKLSESQDATHAFIGIPTSRHPIFERAVHPIFLWQSLDKFPEFILPVRPDQADIRISQQKGCFTFHVPNRPVLTERENSTLKVFEISKERKISIRQQLSMLGIDHFNIYRDLESLAKTIRTNHGIK
jgi:FRG domain